MKVGFVGMGKLGLPVALAVNSKGHKVVGYDVNPEVASYLRDKQIPFREEGIQPLLDDNTVEVVQSIGAVVEKSDIVFLPVQTPHDPEFEGATRIPDARKDFDYTYLCKAIADVSDASRRLKRHVKLVVISTCLPGTYKARIEPIVRANKYITYYYNPFFIAMGTVLKDFLNPEFVLIGSDKEAIQLKEFYRTIHDRPFMETDITTAEGIKVFYNTFITMKTVLANTYGEMAHRLHMNVDDIYKALSMGTDRIISPKYLKAGLGDGGGCHPRDNIALSYIARKAGMSHNIFEDLMRAREDHAEWLATLAVNTAKSHKLPLIMLGRAFKPETNIETGSPAVLIANIIREFGQQVTHVEDLSGLSKAVYFVGTQNERYSKYSFPQGSVVIDPFRYLSSESVEKCTYIPIGLPATMKKDTGVE